MRAKEIFTGQNNDAFGAQGAQLFAFSVAQGDGQSGQGGSVSLEADILSDVNVFTLASTKKSGRIQISNVHDDLVINNLNLITSGQISVGSPTNPADVITEITGDFGQTGDTFISSSGAIMLENVTIQSNSNSNDAAGGATITSQGPISLINSSVNSNANSNGAAGNIVFSTDAGIEIFGEQSGLFAKTLAQGRGGSIQLTANQLTLGTQTEISANSEGSGNAGDIVLNVPQSVLLEANSQLIVETSKSGQAGNIKIATETLTIGEGARLSATATAQATNTDNSGRIAINASTLNIAGELGLFAETLGQAPAGSLTLTPASNDANLDIQFTDNGFISASTAASGKGGDITLSAPRSINIRGMGKISVDTKGRGDAGNIDIFTDNLTLTDGVELTATSTGNGKAGNIRVSLQNQFSANDSRIKTSADKASGGAITIKAHEIQLKNSDIQTNVASGTGGGGDILLRANEIFAVDDSDIIASSLDGSGGNITLNTPVFLGERVSFSTRNLASNTFDGNGAINISATGAIASGTITLPDISFIEESLTELPQTLIDTGALLANSCILRTNSPIGNFIITGAGGRPTRPDDSAIGLFPTGTIQPIPNPVNRAHPHQGWQLGDPIVEPQDVYQLPEGKLVMSRDCAQTF